MSDYAIFIRCEACHAVLAPIHWSRREGADLYTRVDRAAEAHEVTCPCVPLRDRPAGEPRE